MDRTIGIVGGDLRIVKLAKLFEEDGYKVQTCEKAEDLGKDTDVIIIGMPNYAYDIPKELQSKIIDIFKIEELSILNAVPTAEGAIQVAMEESEITLHGSNSLVLGYGRIGKVLCKMLHGIGANVFCEARKEQDLAWIEAYGYNKIRLEDLDKNLEKYDFIFNTIPYLILDEEKLNKIKKDCIIIDLASKPGGVDFDKAKEVGIKAILALRTPRKSRANNCSKVY